MNHPRQINAQLFCCTLFGLAGTEFCKLDCVNGDVIEVSGELSKGLASLAESRNDRVTNYFWQRRCSSTAQVRPKTLTLKRQRLVDRDWFIALEQFEQGHRSSSDVRQRQNDTQKRWHSWA